MTGLIKTLVFSIVIITISGCTANEKSSFEEQWKKRDHILSQISKPEFSDKVFNITDFNAKIGEDACEAINSAIQACNKAGGGTVIVPKGEYYSNGPIILLSNVNLHLEESSTIKFSTNPDDYLPVVKVHWEGVECYNYSPLIYAYQQSNIAVTGKGVLDGQAGDENWWKWKGKKEFGAGENDPHQNLEGNRPLLIKMNAEQIPAEKRIFGSGHYLRPNFIQPFECKNVLIEGVTFLDSPMWFINPVLCENVIVDGVTTKSIGPNTDGCDPESSRNVWIKNCSFSNGDDCIAIKSGRNEDGRRLSTPSENIVIQDCKMKDGHGGVVIGSEISGNVRNVFAENCEMDSPALDRAIRLKSNKYRGGIIENIFVRNITIGEVRGAVVRMNMQYAPKEGNDGKFNPVMRNIYLSNITSKSSKYAFRLEGLEESKISDIWIENSDFNGVKSGNRIENAINVKLSNVKINGKQVTDLDQ